MRTGFVIGLALGLAGLIVADPPRAYAECEACNDAGTPGTAVASRAHHRSHHRSVHSMLPLYEADLPACFWRKMRLWDPDGQYWLVSRVQFCR
jgi:hypothetical protein